MNLLEGLDTKCFEVTPDKVVERFFIRKELNTDWAMHLACLMDDKENPITLPPIVVVPEYEDREDDELYFIKGSDKFILVYGRHRLWAEDKILDRATIKVVVIVSGVTKKSQLISIACRENVGGSLSMTREDFEHTVEEMLKLNVPKKQIPEMLGLPGGLVRRFIGNIESRLRRATVKEVVRDVLENSATLVDASRARGADPAEVRKEIAARTGIKTVQDESDQLKREISGDYKSLSAKNAARFRGLIEQYEDGDVNAKAVFDVFRQVEDLLGRASTTLTDWRKRFEAKVNGSNRNAKK